MTLVSRSTLLSTADLSKKVAILEARLALLEKALKVGATGDVTLKGTSMTIESATALNLKGSTVMSLQSGAQMDLRGPMMNLQAGAQMNLKGALIRLN